MGQVFYCINEYLDCACWFGRILGRVSSENAYNESILEILLESDPP